MSDGLKMKYFVLNPAKRDAYGEASRAAMRSYASVIEPENAQLAWELHEWAYNAGAVQGIAELADELADRKRAKDVSSLERDLAAANDRVAELDGLNALANAQADLFSARWHAANARVAELETQAFHRETRIRGLKSEVNAANARADAAEQRRVAALRLCEEREQALKRAESERDEWKAKCEAAERERDQNREEMARRFDLLQRAESEAAVLRVDLKRVTAESSALSAEVVRLRAEVEHLRGENMHPCGARESELLELRAEVERLRAERNEWQADALLNDERVHAAESRLSTATELLGGAAMTIESLGCDASDIRAFLQTAAPAPTERTNKGRCGSAP